MAILATPKEDALEVFKICTSKVRSEDFRRRLASIEKLISDAALEYLEQAKKKRWFTLTPNDKVGDVGRDELNGIYTSRFAQKGSPGRTIYERLRNAATHNRCPLCSQRTVSTLDHYLPKAKFPAYSVLPINLIPSCIDCNKIKSSEVPAKASDQTLHPYFDDFGKAKWLVASIKRNNPFSVVFSTNPPKKWSSSFRKRLDKHFEVFELAQLYSSHAAREIVGIKHRLKRVLDTAGATGVKRHLREEHESREAARINSWQTALYLELSTNKWFYSGGFDQLP